MNEIIFYTCRVHSILLNMIFLSEKLFHQNVNSNYKKEKQGVKYALMHFINANAVIKRSNDIGNRPTIVNLCFK